MTTDAAPTQPSKHIPQPAHAAVLIVDLLSGTQAYVDTYIAAPPILVIDTGTVEIQLGAPDAAATSGTEAADTLVAAVTAYRDAVHVYAQQPACVP